MTTEIEKRYQERLIIKKETRLTIIIALASLASVAVCTLLAYFVRLEPMLRGKQLETVSDILNIIVIMMLVVILGLRRSIYYSPRFVPEGLTLEQVLQKWRTIDIIMLAVAETIPVMGLVLNWLGMPFNRTIAFFVGSGALIFILMPVGIKVRSKLSILKQTHTNL